MLVIAWLPRSVQFTTQRFACSFHILNVSVAGTNIAVKPSCIDTQTIYSKLPLYWFLSSTTLLRHSSQRSQNSHEWACVQNTPIASPTRLLTASLLTQRSIPSHWQPRSHASSCAPLCYMRVHLSATHCWTRALAHPRSLPRALAKTSKHMMTCMQQQPQSVYHQSPWRHACTSQ